VRVAAATATAAPPPRSIGVADLGCLSGPNTLFLVSTTVDAARCRCAAAGAPCLEIRVFLNDLPGVVS
jgi:jasmonate O-methyltransferase